METNSTSEHKGLKIAKCDVFIKDMWKQVLQSQDSNFFFLIFYKKNLSISASVFSGIWSSTTIIWSPANHIIIEQTSIMETNSTSEYKGLKIAKCDVLKRICENSYFRAKIQTFFSNFLKNKFVDFSECF